MPKANGWTNDGAVTGSARSVDAADPMTERCRICTANDLDAVVEHLADALWDSRFGRDDWPWEYAWDHWQRIFRDFAADGVAALRSSA